MTPKESSEVGPKALDHGQGMAIPNPGTSQGPCPPGCRHLDCHVARALAALPCPICYELLGYQAPILWLNRGFAHVSCLASVGELTGMLRAPILEVANAHR